MAHFLAPLVRDGSAGFHLRHEPTGGLVASAIETAFDSTARRRGLLGRQGLADGVALVIAPCNAIHTCFMRFPIDVVFAARDGRVLKVCPEIPPWRLAAALRGFAAIELPAGAARRHAIAPGDRLKLQREDTSGHVLPPPLV